MDLVKIIINKLKNTKKYWLYPFLTMLIVFTVIIFLSKNPSLAPFLYSNF